MKKSAHGPNKLQKSKKKKKERETELLTYMSEVTEKNNREYQNFTVTYR